MRIDLLWLAAGLARLFLQEMIHQQRHVLEPLTQRRDLHRNHRQPIIKIFAEGAVADFRLQRFVGRADDAHVDRHTLVVAHPAHFALLQHAEQFRLERGRHRVHFVEENGPEVCFLEEPAFVRDRAGEGTFLVPEQFGLEQILRQRAAIDRDERMMLPVAVEVQSARDQLLARAALALNQDRAVGVGDLVDQVVNRSASCGSSR